MKMFVSSRLSRHRTTGSAAVGIFLAMVALASGTSFISSEPSPSSLNWNTCSTLFELRCSIDFEKCDNVLKLGKAIRQTIEHLSKFARVHGKYLNGLANPKRRVLWPEMLRNFKGALPAAKDISVGSDRISLKQNFDYIDSNLSLTIRAMHMESNTTNFTSLDFDVREIDSWREGLNHEQNFIRKHYLHLFLREFFADVRNLHEAFIGVNCSNVHSEGHEES